jgi:hypothetical protein
MPPYWSSVEDEYDPERVFEEREPSEDDAFEFTCHNYEKSIWVTDFEKINYCPICGNELGKA